MKLWISCILVASLVAILIPGDSDAWWFIGRDFWRDAGRVIKTVGCGVACAKQCGGLVCAGTCGLCNGRKRRSSSGIKGVVPDPGFNIVPLPRDFKSYDYDPRDGFIDFNPEFVTAVGLDINHPGTQELFKRADTDKDGRLSRAEFSKAPWVFEDEDDVDDDAEAKVKKVKKVKIASAIVTNGMDEN